MWRGERLAVVLPTYNEADSIAACVKGFEALGIVDEVLVVNNNAHPDTSPAVSTTSAREVFESRQGYGMAIRRGIAETRDFDIVVVCEPDGTFEPDDLWKLLPFLSDVEVVFGTRTVTTFIYAGANMNPFLRWGNWAVAKLIELMFNTVSLSDVGCTYRVLRRSALDEIEPHLESGGSSFGLEMMLEVVARRIPFVQVPVRYLPRVGQSSVTGDFTKAFRLGVEMIAMSVRHRFRTWGNRPRRPQRGRATTNI